MATLYAHTNYQNIYSLAILINLKLTEHSISVHTNAVINMTRISTLYVNKQEVRA